MQEIAASSWRQLKAALPPKDNWHAWFDWYEARLRGDRSSEEIEFIYAAVPLELWLEGPASANAWIKAQLDKRKNPARGSEAPPLAPDL